MNYGDLQLWLVPVLIGLIWLIYFSGKILMLPMRLLFRLSLLAIPVWAALNWGWVREHLHR